MKYALLWLLLFSSIKAQALPFQAPVAPAFQVEPAASLRAFVKDDSLTYVAEVDGEKWTEEREEKDATIGVYKRFFDFLKSGIFYRRQYGVRHDEDWRWQSPHWFWSDVNSRGEDVFIADLSPRLIADFLPGKDWVAELKTRAEFNTYNGQKTFILRPGLTYFLFDKKGAPRAEFFLQYEADLPLNYGVATVYQNWKYLGALYSCSSAFQLGLSAALHTEVWGSTKEFVADTGGSFEVKSQSLSASLLGVFHF